MMLVGAPHELPQINCKLTVGQAVIDKNKPSSRKACFSFAAYAKNVINHMRKCHIPIAEGLSDEEFCNIETTFGFTFPPDLRSILQEGLPIGDRFPQWRVGSHAQIRNLLNLPISALCSEVRSGRFWPSQWGVRPHQLVDAVRVAAHELQRVPTLVPVYANCYISCFPVQAGNPVFLVQESTILYCGYDLADFFKRQAFVPRAELACKSSVFELNSGLSMIKDQINMQRNAEAGANESYKLINGDYSEGAARVIQKDEIKMNSSKGKWRWQDESPRMPTDLLSHVQAYVNYHYHHAKEDVSSLLTPSPPPPTPSPSPSLSSSSSSSSPASKRNSDSDTSSTSSSSSSGKGTHEDQRVGLICKKYLYFYEKPLPSRMLTKFTMAAPPWAATQARKIDFWSDVAESHCLQPPTSYASTPWTPPRLRATLDGSDDHQHTKQCSYNPTLQPTQCDELEYTIYDQPAKPCTDSPFSQQLSSDQHEHPIDHQPAKPCSDSPFFHQNCSDQHDYTIDDQPAKPCSVSSLSDHLISERKSFSPHDYGLNHLDKCSDGSVLEHIYTNSHDYVIYNQPAKRCRSTHPDSAQKCSFQAASHSINQPVGGSSNPSCKDNYINNQQAASQCNNYVEEKNADQLGKMITHTYAGSCRRKSCEWLSTYLDGLADTLRRGRWDEADINDMLMQSNPDHASSCAHPYSHINAARLRSCLHQAGWSHQETSQML